MKFEKQLEHREYLKRKDRNTMAWMVFLAIIFHIGLMYMILPESHAHDFSSLDTGLPPVITIYTPPTPPPEKPEPEKILIPPSEVKIAIPVPMKPGDDPMEIDVNLKTTELIYDPDDWEPPDVLPPSDEPLRVGGDVTPAVLTHYVQPEYPLICRRARKQGMVILECVIDRDGRVTVVKVIQSVNSMLDQAAADAVQQWIYSPGTQNGVPVTVIMNLTVMFRLN